jgi:hypothetical protein
MLGEGEPVAGGVVVAIRLPVGCRTAEPGLGGRGGAVAARWRPRLRKLLEVVVAIALRIGGRIVGRVRDRGDLTGIVVRVTPVGDDGERRTEDRLVLDLGGSTRGGVVRGTDAELGLDMTDRRYSVACSGSASSNILSARCRKSAAN